MSTLTASLRPRNRRTAPAHVIANDCPLDDVFCMVSVDGHTVDLNRKDAQRLYELLHTRFSREVTR